MNELRESLRSSIAVSTAPYGYTLTIWGSGAVAMKPLGSPGLLEVLLYMAGAVVAFLVVEAFAYGVPALRIGFGPPPPVTVWGSAHWLSTGLSIFAAWGIAHAIAGAGVWALLGGVVTLLYLLLNACQVTLAKRQLPDDRRWHPARPE
jgi:hypothetical protein